MLNFSFKISLLGLNYLSYYVKYETKLSEVAKFCSSCGASVEKVTTEEYSVCQII